MGEDSPRKLGEGGASTSGARDASEPSRGVDGEGLGEGVRRALAALELHPDPLIVLGGGGRVLLANARASEVLGLPPGEGPGRVLWDLLEPGDAEALRDLLGGVEEGIPPAHPVSLRLRRKEGGPGAMEASAALLTGDGEEPACALYLRPGRQVQVGGNHLQLAFEHADETVLIADREGRIEYVNRAFETLTGWHLGEVLGRTPAFLKSGEHEEGFYDEIWATLAGGNPWRGVIWNRRRDGTLFAQQQAIAPVLDEAGTIAHFVATGVEVTQQVEERRRLKAQAERFAASLRGSNDGLWDWDFRTDRLHLTPRWKDMLGYGEGEVGDSPEAWFGLVHQEDLPELRARIQAHLEGNSPHLEVEHRILHRDGEYRWVRTRGLAVKDEGGHPVRMAGSQTDIMDRKLAEEQIRRGALRDALTGLPNRTLFLDRVRSAIARVRTAEAFRFMVLFMDLDRFKVINDSLGHLMGDRLLVEVGKRVRGCLRATDTVARLGGDEFAILVEEVPDDREAVAFAERILSELRHPFQLAGREIYTSGSIGIALHQDAYSDPADMIRDADTAMYQAKGRGRNRAALFDQAMHSKALRILELETDLRQAVEANRLTVHYQPIVALATGRVAGFESLSRWLHPKKGYISPADFIPIAEETGLIHPLGINVLKESCRRLKALQAAHPCRPPLFMSVNLSGTQFLRHDLLNQIDLVLRDFGLNPRDLKLEITESVIIEHAEHARLMIDQFKAQSVRLSIDDFGTGYSSLSNLRKFPIDTVKIDQSFVRKMCEDDECLEIVRATIHIAHNLKMDVVAEGVETRDQARLLKGMQCEYGQGFFFSKAVPADETDPLVERGWFI